MAYRLSYSDYAPPAAPPAPPVAPPTPGSIPGGPSFGSFPQPPDVPCDPTGDGWRGPPGPPGPPTGALTQDTPPANPVAGQLWFDSSNPQLYIWFVDPTSAQWVIATAYAGGLTTDAPRDGHVYGRQNGAWIDVSTTGVPYLPLVGGTVSGPTTFQAGLELTGDNTTTLLGGHLNARDAFPAAKWMADFQAVTTTTGGLIRGTNFSVGGLGNVRIGFGALKPDPSGLIINADGFQAASAVVATPGTGYVTGYISDVPGNVWHIDTLDANGGVVAISLVKPIMTGTTLSPLSLVTPPWSPAATGGTLTVTYASGTTLSLQSAGGPTVFGGPVNYTATGGTVARSAQDRAATFMTVEDFGALGDGVADDANAFDAYAAYLRAQIITGRPQLAWTLGHGRKYFVSRSIDLTGFSHFRFEGNHSRILSSDLTHPVIDMLGSDNCVLANIRILHGSQAAPGLVGILYGVTNDTQGHPNVTLENVEIDGYFTRACVQNSGSEVNLIHNPIFINRYTSGTPGSTWCLIQDGMHHWDLNSRYITDSRTRDHYYSFLGQEVVGGALQNVGDGSCVWNGCGSQHHFRNTYMQVVSAVPIAVLAFNSDAAGQFKYDFVWEVHSEVGPSAIFSITNITGSATIVLSGFTLRDEMCQVSATGSVFRAEASVPAVRIIDANILLPQWLNSGSLMFSSPASKFTLNGRLALLNAAFSHWNAPSGGFLELQTDSRTGFTAGMYNRLADNNAADMNIAAVTCAALTASGAATLSAGGTFTGTFAGAHTYSGALTLAAAGNALTVTNQAVFGSAVASAGVINVGTGAGTVSSLLMIAAAGTARNVTFRSGAVNRWNLYVNAATESGSSVGSDFALDRYDDSGAYLGTPITVNRATGQVSITGSTTNNSASAGQVGEVIQIGPLGLATVSLSNNVPANVGSVTLSAGDWDCYGHGGFVVSAGATALAAAISTTSATLPPPAQGGQVYLFATFASGTHSHGAMCVRLSLAASTTVYLVAQAAFAAGTVTAGGTVFFRRAR